MQINDPSKPDAVLSDAAEGSTAVADIFVSKEDRRVNDFDRIRPRSRLNRACLMLRRLLQIKGTRVLGVDHPLWKPRPISQLIHPFLPEIMLSHEFCLTREATGWNRIPV